MEVPTWVFLLLALGSHICFLVHAEKVHLSLPKDCGRVPAKTSRIAGGYEAEAGSFPSYVALKLNQNFTCGGSIITNRLVLTAAHCVIPKFAPNYTMTVDLESTRAKSSGSMSEYLVNTVCVSKHWHFSLPMKNDLAVLQLNQPLKFDKYTQPACLPRRRLDEQTQAFIVGMGLNETGQLSGKLKVVQTKRAGCSAAYNQTAFVCPKSTDHQNPGSSCSGDSGGPLIANVNGRQTVFGLTSQGQKDCAVSPDFLPAYVDLYATRDLVQQLVRDCSEYL